MGEENKDIIKCIELHDISWYSAALYLANEIAFSLEQQNCKLCPVATNNRNSLQTKLGIVHSKTKVKPELRESILYGRLGYLRMNLEGDTKLTGIM